MKQGYIDRFGNVDRDSWIEVEPPKRGRASAKA